MPDIIEPTENTTTDEGSFGFTQVEPSNGPPQNCCEPAPITTGLSPEALIEKATEWKTEGNTLFRNAQYLDAIPVYTQAIEAIVPVVPQPKPPRAPPSADKKTENGTEEKGNQSGADNNDNHKPADTSSSSSTSSTSCVDPVMDQPEEPLDPTIAQLAELLAMCLSNRGACHSKLEAHDKVVQDCTDALKYRPKYARALHRRAEACEVLGMKAVANNDCLEASGKLQMAVDDWRKVLEIEPSNKDARPALYRLEPELKRQHEKMKDEMIDKLKGLGNFVLGKFGLSLNNFSATKDPNTGGYSIQFQQNPTS